METRKAGGMRKWKWSGRPGEDLHDCLKWCVMIAKPQSYLEIGVDGGGSLRTVLETAQRHRYVPGRIDLCDLWTGHAGHTFKDFEHIKPILAQFSAHATFHPGDSGVTVPNIRGPFDLILVDGDHSFEGAYTDLTNAWPLLRVGGMLVLDDLGHAVYPGVHEAYRLWLANTEGVEMIEEASVPYRNCCILTKR